MEVVGTAFFSAASAAALVVGREAMVLAVRAGGGKGCLYGVVRVMLLFMLCIFPRWWKLVQMSEPLN